MSATRNLFGADHGRSGKGDKPRTKFDERWAKNYAAIQGFSQGNHAGFSRSRRGWTKRYS